MFLFVDFESYSFHRVSVTAGHMRKRSMFDFITACKYCMFLRGKAFDVHVHSGIFLVPSVNNSYHRKHRASVRYFVSKCLRLYKLCFVPIHILHCDDVPLGQRVDGVQSYTRRFEALPILLTSKNPVLHEGCSAADTKRSDATPGRRSLATVTAPSRRADLYGHAALAVPAKACLPSPASARASQRRLE